MNTELIEQIFHKIQNGSQTKEELGLFLDGYMALLKDTIALYKLERQ